MTDKVPRAFWIAIACGSLIALPVASSGQDAERPIEPTWADAIVTSPTLPARLEYDPPTSLDDVRQLEQHIKQLLKKIEPATVSLAGGSGVVVTADGYILTCAHVIREPGRVITITFPDGRRVRGITLGGNQTVDAGLAKITEPGKYPFVPMGRSGEVRPGQWCLALGYPITFSRGKSPATRFGRVRLTKPRMLVTDCTIMGGDSGGPLFDIHGNVIGINSRVNASIETNIHVPIDAYREAWSRLAANEVWSEETRRPYLGISRNAEMDRVVIAKVTPGSPADQAGVQVGDELLQIDKQQIRAFEDLLSHLERHAPGDVVVLQVKRKDANLTLSVTLQTWPETTR